MTLCSAVRSGLRIWLECSEELEVIQNITQQKRSESAQGWRIALYKTEQQSEFFCIKLGSDSSLAGNKS